MTQLINVKATCGFGGGGVGGGGLGGGGLLWTGQMQEVTLLLAEVYLCLGMFHRVRELYDPNVDGGVVGGGGSGSGPRGSSTVHHSIPVRAASVSASAPASSGSGSGSGSGSESTLAGVGSGPGSSNHHQIMFLSKLNAARGVAYFAEGHMREAANSFLAITGGELLRNEYNRVLSKEDIALYGGLAALLALDRREMGHYFSVDKSRRPQPNHDHDHDDGNGNGSGSSSSSSSFQNRLDAIPELRDAIQAYIRADYGECLRLVDVLRHA